MADPGMVLTVGTLILGDMHTMHGHQVQPAFAETDNLYVLGPQNMLDIKDVQWDRHHDHTQLATRFVPFNQKSFLPTVRDRGKHNRTGSPAVRWETITTAGATQILQEFKESHYGYAYWQTTVKNDAEAQTAKITATCDHIELSDGTSRPMAEREVSIHFSRNLFTRAQTTSGKVTISIKVGGYWYRSEVSSTRPTKVDKSTDGGSTHTQVKDHLKGGGSDHAGAGSTGDVRLGAQVELRIKAANGRLTLSQAGSAAAPLMVSLAKDTRWGILGVALQRLQLAPGAVAALPPPPFKAHCWPGGVGAELTLREVTVTAANPLNDQITVTGSLAGIAPGGTLDILDPRIEAVKVEAEGYTQFCVAVHPMRYVTTGYYTRAPFQTGFVPLPETVAGFTIHTDGEVGGVLDGNVYNPTLLPGAAITPKLTLAGSVGYYRLDMTGPDKDMSDQEVYESYLGQEYAEDTPILTRVTTRFEGISEVPGNAFFAIPLGVGGENPVQSITESIAFDPGSLTIRHSASVTLDNFRGMAALSAATGIGGLGNVGVGIRLGYAHQQGLVSDGVLGLPRFWGFSSRRSFTVAQGGGAANMILDCQDQMAQLAEVLIAAPADLDGHNHYWAMAYLAQLAGIPLPRMAFAPLVPSDPYGASPYDTAPYFLPMGAGMRPWTPVNRTLPVLSLMDQVRKTTGYLLYFDAIGQLRYEPFLPIFNWLAGPKRIFRPTPEPSATARDWRGGLTELWDLQVSFDVSEVKNQTLLVGIDSEQSWGVIASKLEDQASISSPAGYQPINYKGYKAPFIWMDSRFANEGFALRSSARLFYWLRQPAVTVTFTCWAQPDLFPLDMIWVNDWRTGIAELPFYILSMSTTTPSHGLPRTTITARYLDPILLSGFL